VLGTQPRLMLIDVESASAAKSALNAGRHIDKLRDYALPRLIPPTRPFTFAHFPHGSRFHLFLRRSLALRR
jgi:hypothetical protein